MFLSIRTLFQAHSTILLYLKSLVKLVVYLMCLSYTVDIVDTVYHEYDIDYVTCILSIISVTSTEPLSYLPVASASSKVVLDDL
jgi:hypothetical protein